MHPGCAQLQLRVGALLQCAELVMEKFVNPPKGGTSQKAAYWKAMCRFVARLQIVSGEDKHT